ncbi:putative membrane protein [Aciduliprofundum sp. MAR08-339]|uniref:PH domain-containing protein n=1 Tax=Aciduliprofundum sp. (strain MAR08-339) TaxID=673860 RepID=UPI0002A4919D|nr:putative membrane protein [Aciduliprofundum sp. MAR08-339]
MEDNNAPKYCPYCGKEIDPSWKVCPYCGNKLSFENIDNGELNEGTSISGDKNKESVTPPLEQKEDYIPNEGYHASNPTPTGLSLVDGEIVEWYGRRSFKSFIGGIIITLLLFISGIIFGIIIPYFGVILFFLGLLLILRIVIKWISTEYAITNKRVYSRHGWISRKISETTFDKITDISISQGVWGRLLNYGDVLVNTAGSLGYEIKFEGVSDPKYIEVKIRAIGEKYKKQERIKERLERLEDRYLVGEITLQQYEEAKKKLENMIK